MATASLMTTTTIAPNMGPNGRSGRGGGPPLGQLNHYNPDLTASTEKILESAAATGKLQLAGRNLKRFPKHNQKFHLKDTIHAGKMDTFGRTICFFVPICSHIPVFLP